MPAMWERVGNQVQVIAQEGGVSVEKEATFGVWRYIMTDARKPVWKCSECGKICRRNPHEKNYCSNCGAKMRMEA